MGDVRGDISIRDCLAEEQRSSISNTNHSNLHRNRSDNAMYRERRAVNFRLINNLYFVDDASSTLHFSASTSRNLRSRSTAQISRVLHTLCHAICRTVH